MKKIPTLFSRVYDNHILVGILPEVNEGLEWVLNGEGIATIKWDGSACCIKDGKLYIRYDAKKGKPIPENAIKCQDEPDPITGHMPCWMPADENNPAHKWFFMALRNAFKYRVLDLDEDGTYEAIGPHFNGNPYKLQSDILIIHGRNILPVIPRTFEGIKEILTFLPIEGLVFWKDGEPKCKIKRTDFGLDWPCKCSEYIPHLCDIYAPCQYRIENDIRRLFGRTNGLYVEVSDLKDRVDKLEE